MSVNTRREGRTYTDVFEDTRVWSSIDRERIEDLTWSASDVGVSRRVHSVLTGDMSPSLLTTDDWIEFLCAGPRTFALKCVTPEAGGGTFVTLTALSQNEVASSRDPTNSVGIHDPHSTLVRSYLDHYHPIPVAYDDVEDYFQ